jgi:hypothetical protein
MIACRSDSRLWSWLPQCSGQLARALAPNFAEWEAVLPGASAGAVELRAQATDAAGNVEPRPHVVAVP